MVSITTQITKGLHNQIVSWHKIVCFAVYCAAVSGSQTGSTEYSDYITTRLSRIAQDWRIQKSIMEVETWKKMLLQRRQLPEEYWRLF